MEFRVKCYDEVGSTNELVKRAIEGGEPEGLAVAARVQTAGYGRQGRAWASPAGGMYLSLLLRPDVPLAQLPTLSLVVGMAVRRAVASLVPEDAAERVLIKWPNDVVVGDSACVARVDATGGPIDVAASSDAGEVSADPSSAGEPAAPSATSAPFRKICGISLEQHAGGICVGIGVNVAPPEGDDAAPQVGGKNVPAYVADLAGRTRVGDDGAPSASELIERVRVAVLREFGAFYERWVVEGFAALLDEYAAHAALTGMRVSIVNLDGSVQVAGTVRGVDAFGRLLVEPSDAFGRLLVESSDASGVVAVSSGEAHVTLA